MRFIMLNDINQLDLYQLIKENNKKLTKGQTINFIQTKKNKQYYAAYGIALGKAIAKDLVIVFDEQKIELIN